VGSLKTLQNKFQKNKNRGAYIQKTKGGRGAGGKSNARARYEQKITGRILYIFLPHFSTSLSLDYFNQKAIKR
jgi:hypothetical protein